MGDRSGFCSTRKALLCPLRTQVSTSRFTNPPPLPFTWWTECPRLLTTLLQSYEFEKFCRILQWTSAEFYKGFGLLKWRCSQPQQPDKNLIDTPQAKEKKPRINHARALSKENSTISPTQTLRQFGNKSMWYMVHTRGACKIEVCTFTTLQRTPVLLKSQPNSSPFSQLNSYNICI